jgi:hypothetical protein
MTSSKQLALLLVVVVGGVGWFTFMSQYTRKPPEVKARNTASPAADGRPTEALHVPEKIAQWDVADPLYHAEFETGSRGQYDFWVTNAHAKPVELKMLAKGCTCSEVQLGKLDPEAWSAWCRRVAGLAAVDAISSLLGGPAAASPLAFPGLPEKITWQTMEREQKMQVPAADPRHGPQVAIVRLKWEAKEPRPQRLTASLEHRFGDLIEDTVFEVPIQIVYPMLVYPASLTVPDLNYNDVREIGFYCWSATRPDLDLNIEEVLHDPCIDIGKPRPLPPAELAELAAKINAPNMRVKCGYFVPVTVYERRGGHQLDLGPLTRKISIKGGKNAEAVIMLSGWVRSGSLHIGDAADKDRIDLGSFPAKRGTTKNVRITSNDPDLRLQIESYPTDWMKVDLTEVQSSGGRKIWDLAIEVVPERSSGQMVGNNAVVLQTVSPQPRKIRLPIIGNAHN